MTCVYLLIYNLTTTKQILPYTFLDPQKIQGGLNIPLKKTLNPQPF